MAQLTPRTHIYEKSLSDHGRSTRGERLRRFLRERSSVQRGVGLALCCVVCAVVIRMGGAYLGSVPSSGVLLENQSQNMLQSSSRTRSTKGASSDEFGGEHAQTNEEHTSELSKEADAHSSQDEIVVHIDGCVKSCGIVRLSARACRVDDAIRAAGGTTDEADLTSINRAQILEDGQKLYIPKIGEHAHLQDEMAGGEGDVTADSDDRSKVSSADDTRASSRVRKGAKHARTKASSHKISINRATVDELQTITGIGPAMAQRIVRDRKTHGRFKKIDELMRVKGIGKKKFAKIRPHITL